MMVNGRHAEETLSAGPLEIRHLDHDREHLGEINESDHRNEQRQTGYQREGGYEAAEGKRPGNPEAAKAAFAEMGTVAGNAMALAAQLMDGIVVIGGGISASAKYFMPYLLEEMRGTVKTLSGDTLNRVQMKVYNLDNPEEFAAFAKGEARELKIYGTDKTVTYDPQKRIGITIDKIGTSTAISVGAYDFALAEMDK